MRLTEEEKRILNGEHGKTKRLSMEIEVELAEAFGVDEMIPITAAHVDADSYATTGGEAKLDFARRMGSTGATFAVPTTLNPGGRDIDRWREFRIPEWFASKSEELERLYLGMGAIPTWTCAPYTYGTIPCKGENIAYAESNAIVFANSVLGARTPRYGDFFEVCAALTGRAPRFDLYLDENRFADIRFDVSALHDYCLTDDLTFALLGYLIGRKTGNKVPVITGLHPRIDRDKLKTFSAAIASSGSVGLFHIVGMTPEAPSLQSVARPSADLVQINVDDSDLDAVKKELSSAKECVDLVLMGCPHASVTEFMELSRLLNGQIIAKNVEFWVQTNRVVFSWIDKMGILSQLEHSKVRISTDSCIFNWPLDEWGFQSAVTNSAKFAHYCPGELGMDCSLTDLAGCVKAAVTGEIEEQ
jgi:cis-L-3-hydroxyproline dehydratase